MSNQGYYGGQPSYGAQETNYNQGYNQGYNQQQGYNQGHPQQVRNLSMPQHPMTTLTLF